MEWRRADLPTKAVLFARCGEWWCVFIHAESRVRCDSSGRIGEHRVLRQESMQRVRAMNEEAESLFVAQMAAELERNQRSDGVSLPTSLVEEAGESG